MMVLFPLPYINHFTVIGVMMNCYFWELLWLHCVAPLIKVSINLLALGVPPKTWILVSFHNRNLWDFAGTNHFCC